MQLLLRYFDVLFNLLFNLCFNEYLIYHFIIGHNKIVMWLPEVPQPPNRTTKPILTMFNVLQNDHTIHI